MAILNIGSASFRFDAVDVRSNELVFKLGDTVLITIDKKHNQYQSIKKEVAQLNS